MRLGLQEHSCDLYCLQALGLFRQSYGTLDGTTKDNRVFRAICGTSVHIGQRVDTLSHYALLATPQTELRIMLATALAPPCLGTGTSAPPNRLGPTIAGVHGSGGGHGVRKPLGGR